MKKTFLLMILAILAAIVMLLASVIFYENFITTKKRTIDSNHSKEQHISLPSIKSQVPTEVTRVTVKPKEKTDILTIATEIDDYVSSQKHKEENISKALLKPSCKVVVKKPKPQKKRFYDNIPRVAIIMDDIGNARQVRAFKKIPFALTPSIFPATSRHPDTPQYAKKFKCYMVHMPMEAFNFSRPEENTLDVNDTLEVIEEKIATIHQAFPDAVAYNNHTGSKFTSNAASMDRLFCILEKYDINFIDSKTAPHSKGKKVGALHHKVVWERNIFLDNKPDVDYILNQLKKAVRYAKKHGVAIAICHPRPETFEAFKRASKILKGVKMVTIDELFL
jgi:polysaccharide deacetylase 2 family uncharacterized protein YibQ